MEPILEGVGLPEVDITKGSESTPISESTTASEEAPQKPEPDIIDLMS